MAGVLVFLLTSQPARALLSDCRRPGDACGQCEPQIQSQFDSILSAAESGEITSVEAFLQRMTQTNPAMTNNFVVIGDSKSTQTTRPGFPRIAFKSPESELWVTFNTDPLSEGYNRLEIIRWNGREGRFDFQEVQFTAANSGAAARAHVRRDAKADCVRCHRDMARPNFDTYVAWAGFLPPRDDVLERLPNGQPDPNAAAYLEVMERVVRERAAGGNPPSRWAALNIPPANASGTDAQRLQRIRNGIRDDGPHESAGSAVFGQLNGYRIPHVPPTRDLRNTSPNKTLPLAGFGHLAFDQSIAQQMCQVGTELTRRPDFNQIKFSLGYVLQCDADPSDVRALLPYEALVRADDHFRAGGLTTLPSDTHVGPTAANCVAGSAPACPSGGYANTRVCRLACNTGSQEGYRYMFGTDCPAGWEPMPGQCAGGGYTPTGGTARRVRAAAGELYNAVVENTRLNQRLLDTHKADRHARFLREARHLDAVAAARDGERVRGVPDTNLAEVSAMRYLLEPLGVNVADWSLSYGDNLAIPSYTFADQFADELRRQPFLAQLRRSYEQARSSGTTVGGESYCQWLRRNSELVFPRPATPPPADVPGPSPARANYQRFLTECRTAGRTDPGQEVPSEIANTVGPTAAATQRQLREDARVAFRNCMGCHSSASGEPQAGAANAFPAPAPASTYASRLQAFLRSNRGTSGMTWMETIAIATDHSSAEPGIEHMPPYVSDANRPRVMRQLEALRGYLTSIMLSADGQGTGFACEIVSQEDLGRTPAAPQATPNGATGADTAE